MNFEEVCSARIWSNCDTEKSL